MATSAAHAFPLDATSNETTTFFRILTHDDRGARYVIARKSDKGWSEICLRPNEFSDELRYFTANTSYYITRNGFKSRNRKVENLYQVNALMYDIDAHGENGASVVPEIITTLKSAFEKGSLPSPNLFVNTGRGAQIYYVLENSTAASCKDGSLNKKGLGWVRGVQNELGNSIEKVISHISGAELDKSVYDFARVGRIPGSMNPNAGAKCSLISFSEAYWTLKGLAPWCIKNEVVKASKRPAPILRFDRVQINRMKNIEDLQEYREFDCEGSRQNMCFVYYNSATQVHGPQTAMAMLRAFNRKFKKPLPGSDLKQIKNTVDNVEVLYGARAGEKGFYPLSAQTVVEKLFISPEEIKETGFFRSIKQMKRAAAKAETKRKREARDKEIIRLVSECGKTQAEVAQALSISKRTVAGVVAKAGVKRALKASKGQLELMREHLDEVKVSKDAKNCPTSWDCYAIKPNPENPSLCAVVSPLLYPSLTSIFKRYGVGLRLPLAT